MGNTNITQLTKEQILSYQQKYKNMEDTIRTNNDTIRMLMAEKDRLTATVDQLNKDVKKKDEETKRRLNDVRNSKKSVDSELNKYKSVPEFEAILNLNTDLVDFQNKIKAAIDANCNMFKTNKHDDEIEQTKRRNAELYGKLKNSNVQTLITEKSKTELKEAENDLNTKKEIIRQEFVKINSKLMQIKEKMAQATTKFAGTVENSILELRKNLVTYQKEMAAIEQGNSKTDDSLIYEKVKNILLQQENALMKEMIASNAGPSTNLNINPPIQKVFNNLSVNPNPLKNKNTNANDTNPFLTDNSNFLFLNKQGATKENITNFESSSEDSDNEDSYSIVDDDVSECGSTSGRPKTYKVILLNVHEEGNKTDEQKVRMVLKQLTNLSLDDIHVHRVGKPFNKPRPIVVAFDSYQYIQELLKNRFSLRNTNFSSIRVCPYKSKPNSNDTKKDNKPRGPRKPRGGHKNNASSQGRGGKNSKDPFSPF